MIRNVEPSVRELGQFVRSYRKANRITQRQLALLAGTSEEFVVNLERGKPTLRFDKLLSVLDILGLQLVIQPGKGDLIVAAR